MATPTAGLNRDTVYAGYHAYTYQSLCHPKCLEIPEANCDISSPKDDTSSTAQLKIT